MTPEQAQFWQTFGILAGFGIMAASTVAANLPRIGVWLGKRWERREQRADEQDGRERELGDFWRQSNQQTRQALVDLYDRLLRQEQERSQYAQRAAQEWIEINQRKQDEISSVMLDAVRAATETMGGFADKIGQYSASVEKQTEVLGEIRDSQIALRTAMERTAFVESQLVFILNREKGTSTSLPVQSKLGDTGAPE